MHSSRTRHTQLALTLTLTLMQTTTRNARQNPKKSLGGALAFRQATARAAVFPGSLFGLAAYCIAALVFVTPRALPYGAMRRALGGLLLECLACVVFPIAGVSFAHVLLTDALTSGETDCRLLALHISLFAICVHFSRVSISLTLHSLFAHSQTVC